MQRIAEPTRRRHRSRRIPFAACAALALLGLALPAGDAAARPSWGVSSQTPLGAVDIARMGQAKVGILRTLFSWSTVEPAPGTRDWEAIDAIVADAAAHGIQVLPVLYGTPAWIAERLDRRRCAPVCDVYPPRSNAALRVWRRFVADAVRRYGRGGTFWEQHPALPKRPVATWQVWNEQNSPDFFAPRISIGRYRRLLGVASGAIRGANRRAEVVLGGMAEIAGVHGARTGWSYLRALYRRPGVERDFDGVAPHPYAADVTGVRRQIRKTRRVVRWAGDPGASMWITEIGLASGDGGDPFEVGPAAQARHLRRSFAFVRARRVRLNARAVVWFSWRDSPTAICAWCPTSGLFDHSYGAKPAFRAFTRFTGGS
jgi:polysaccharide biosynthesis protein PslG